MDAAREQQLLDIIAHRDAELLRLRQENELLRQKLDLVIRKLFGSSSEKLDPAQLELLLADDPSKKPAAAGDTGVPAAEDPGNIPASRTAARIGRKPRVPDHLPVEETILDPEPVKACPEAWRWIGSETSDQLDYQPGKFLCRRLVRRKYVRVADRDAPPIIAPLPAGLQDGCLATPALIAEIVVNKYAWHQPLYRQESLFTHRHGVAIPRQTMMNWEALAADWLRPLHQLLRTSLLTSGYLQVDETPVRYLEPGHGKTKTGYFWVYRAGDGTLLYDWRPSRAHDCLDHVLRLERHGEEPLAFEGILQSDGYAAYETYRRLAAARGQPIELAACWAHARRKLHDALDSSPRLAGWLLRQLGHLYAVEARLRENRSGPNLRQAIRSSESRPVYQRIGKALTLLRKRSGILPKSHLGIAIRYILDLWPRLGVFLRDGRVEIDTNHTENAIRPSAVGKKNWLFVGSEDSGWKAAIFYTLIANCRLHGIDPHGYFKEVLERLPSCTNHQLPGLLPANWAKRNRLEAAG
jgi:transposase